MNNVLLLFFFFKQKTVYEMRISDWSSDVCSSDLIVFAHLENRTSLGPNDFKNIALRNSMHFDLMLLMTLTKIFVAVKPVTMKICRNLKVSTPPGSQKLANTPNHLRYYRGWIVLKNNNTEYKIEWL